MPEINWQPDEPVEPVRIELDVEGNVQNRWAERIRGLRAREREINPIPRRRNNVPQVLDTLGIELESIALSRDNVARILTCLPNGLGNNFKVHRDGSAEINAYIVSINGGNQYITVSSHTEEAENLLEGKYPKNTIGYELISIPMYTEDMEKTIYSLLPALESGGDFISERCATHIHVGGMKNLGFLKNCLKLGLWFDEVFFSLAHMDGKKFRGYSNNAIYARPLVNGPYFKVNRDYYQVLNYEKALDSRDLYEFFSCYGANIEGEIIKWVPARYFSINLYSIPRIGTVEFRHFNQSFNPVIVTSVAKLCQLFVEVAIKSRMSNLLDLGIGNPFKLESPSHYLHKLYQFLDMAASLECDYMLDNNNIRELERVIYNYKGIGVENVEVLTHCRDFEISRELIETGELKKSKNKPIPDGHTDIHNIKYSSILGE